jgi:hypothetical protein
MGISFVGIVVKQVRQGARLIRQAGGLVFGVAVHIVERRHGQRIYQEPGRAFLCQDVDP